MAKPKLVRNTNDFIIGIALFILGVYVLFTDDIVLGTIPPGIEVSPLIQPDVYVRLIGGFLAFFAAILVNKSINYSRITDTKGFRFVISLEAVLTMAALIIYTILLTIIGFFISTFILIFFLTCMYLRREKAGKDKPPLTRKEISRDLIIALVYSALLVLAVYLIFTRFLYVALP